MTTKRVKWDRFGDALLDGAKAHVARCVSKCVKGKPWVWTVRTLEPMPRGFQSHSRTRLAAKRDAVSCARLLAKGCKR